MNAIAARAIEAMDFLVDAVQQIPSESWDLPSNLEGWSIRDLVAHTTGSAAKIVTLVEGGEVSPAPSEPADWKSDDPPAQLREVAARLKDALAGADLDALQPALSFPSSACPYTAGMCTGRRAGWSSCPTTWSGFAVRWRSRCRRTSCAGRVDSGRPSRRRRTRRRRPG